MNDHSDGTCGCTEKVEITLHKCLHCTIIDAIEKWGAVYGKPNPDDPNDPELRVMGNDAFEAVAGVVASLIAASPNGIMEIVHFLQSLSQVTGGAFMPMQVHPMQQPDPEPDPGAPPPGSKPH